MNKNLLLNQANYLDRNKARRDFAAFKPLIDDPISFENFILFEVPANCDLYIKFEDGDFPESGNYPGNFQFQYGTVYYNPGIVIKRYMEKIIPLADVSKYQIYLGRFEKGDIVSPAFYFGEWEPPTDSCVYIENGVGKKTCIGVAP